MPDDHNTHLWGTSHAIHRDDQVELVLAVGKAGGASSTHMHHHKHNTFLVRDGKVRIWICNTFVLLNHADSITVRAGIKHRMEFVTDAEVLEIYSPTYDQSIDPADIVRFDEGTSPTQKAATGVSGTS